MFSYNKHDPDSIILCTTFNGINIAKSDPNETFCEDSIWADHKRLSTLNILVAVSHLHSNK